MTTDAKPSRPIGTVRIGTPVLVGIVLALAAPVAVTEAVYSDGGRENSFREQINLAGPITQVVVKGENDSIHVVGDAKVGGAVGEADLSWGKHPPTVTQDVTNGVLTLSYTCEGGGDDCGGVNWDIKVPAAVALRAETTNGDIDVTGILGGVTAKTTNSRITARGLGDGPASFTTDNSGVDVAFDGAPDQITVSTTNGHVWVKTNHDKAYYDDVTTTNGSTVLTNNRDRGAQATITVSTTNNSVTIS